jgi:CRISPR system Cascade subunit CasD
MREHLIFTLTAALGAMGELAGHERRGTWTWPGRSAILGLLAAAKGVRRAGDFSALDRLSLSVAVFDAGTPLRDYHTVQTVPTAKVKRPQSRPLALREVADEANTTITLRDYRTCPLFGVAIAGDGLSEVCAALERPAFVLYLGRKSCPLSAPLAPRIVTAPDAATALKLMRLPPWWPKDKAVATTLISDLEGTETAMTETRHDAPLDRRLWHFAERRFQRHTVHITPQEVV